MQLYLRPFALDIVRLSIWLAILIVIFIPLERLFPLRPQKVFRKSILADVGYYFVNNLFPKLLLIVPIAILAWFLHFLIPSGFHARVAALPMWTRVLGALIVGEIGFYWGHRWSHEIPFLWRFHSLHHSAEEMDWLVNTHAHPLDIVFTRMCGFVPMYVLGLAQAAVRTIDPVTFLVLFIGTLWGFFIHANVKWRFGPLEWLVATPAFHHWHHTYDGPINRNYAPLLPWMDVLFGTHYRQGRQWPERYGTETAVASSMTGQILEPLMPNIRSKPVVSEQSTAAMR